ncbi:endonuclease VII [Pseudomonas phage PaGz-1]|uniref:Endonuclease VII n=1 Tax=Pseudomonas phage PaGz-1 TaxID=2419748 RepID=A0A411B961_9CAUD|nr:endonuclease VII [Pseudomonas phage PaGz-1]QAX98161.1 endonuclease VII [Pseudomonas phage PaGz-1]
MGRYARAGRSQAKMTAKPEKYPQGRFKDKPCRWCGTVFSPAAPSHLYCGDDCNQLAHDDARLKKAYGLTLRQYRAMVEEFDEKCGICGEEGFELVKGQRLKLVIDHCHETGRVRGLLCHNCNRGLGLFQDSIRNLKSAAEYLGRCNDYRNHGDSRKGVE